MKIKQRKRAGTKDAFDRRYDPIPDRTGNTIRDWRDPEVQAANIRYIWTCVDCNGRLYVVPGFATVNYFGRVLCKNPWPDEEENNTGYCF